MQVSKVTREPSDVVQGHQFNPTEIDIYRRTAAKISKIPNRLVIDYLPKNRKAKISNNHEKKTIYTIQSILTIVMQGQIIPQPQSTSASSSKLVSL
jgi:hypothetical protein